MLDNIVRDWSVMLDGVMLRGDLDMCDLPKISRKVDEYRGAGMDRPVEIDMGYDKMDFTMEMTKMDPASQALVATLNGASLATGLRPIIKVYGYMIGYDGTQTGFTDEMQGMVKDIDQIGLKPGDKTKIKYSIAVDSYGRSIGGKEVFYFDPLNLILRVNGVDQYTVRRQILGFGG